VDSVIPAPVAGTPLLQDLFEAAPDGVLVVRPDGVVVEANPEAAVVFGYERDRLASERIEDLVPDAGRPIQALVKVAEPSAASVRRLGGRRELTGRRADGTEFAVDVALAPFRSGDETFVCVVVTDVSRRRAAEDRSRALAELSAVLSATARVDEIADLVVERAASILAADDAGLVVREGDELVLVRRSVNRIAADHPNARRIPLDARGAVAAAVRTGQPFLPRIDGAAPARSAPGSGALGFEVALPLIATGPTLGALGLSFPEERTLAPADVPFLELLARTCAQALDRARLYEAERKARARATALARLSTAVAEARTVDEVAQVLLDEAYATSSAQVVALARHDAEAGEFELLGMRSGSRRIDARARWPWSLASPARDVVETGERVLVDRAAYVARYPEVAAIADPLDIEAYLALPLTVGGTAIGSIAFSFVASPVFEDDDIAHLQALADAGAQAMERARVLEVDRLAREQADADRRFADEAAEVLSGSLRPHDAAAALAALVVPRYADWCAIDLGDETGRIRDTLIVHPDPAKVALGYRLRDRWPVPPDAPSGPPAILRNGQPEFMEAVPADYASAIEDPELRAIMAGLGIVSYVAVPIRARGRTLGALSGFMAESGRRFTDNDLHRLLDVGRRAGVAFDTAMLYEAVVRVAEDERRARERADALTRLNAAVAEARSTEEVAGLLLRELVAATSARAGSVVLADGPEFVEIASVAGDPPIRGLPRFRRDVASPAADVLRTGDVLQLARAAYLERYPELGAPDGEALATIIVVPLVIGAARVGAATLLFADERELAGPEVSHLRGLADGGAQALERARLADTERRARATLDQVLRQLPAAIVVAEPSGDLVYVNEHVEALLRGSGPPRIDSFGVPAFDGDGEPYAADDYPLSRSLRRGEVVVDEEMELERYDGSRVTVLASSSPVLGDDGSILGAVVVMTDITPRKQVEAAREAFIGGLSHELRTPITAIYGNAAILRARLESLSRPAVEGIVDDIATEADRMRRIVEDLLMLARVERGIGLDGPEPILLQHRIRAIVERVARRWPKVSFDARVQPDLPPVRGDDTYIERTLENLLDNAAKYGEKEVRVSATWEGGDEVLVQVVDDGPGVDPSESGAIFEVFYRSKRDARRATGAGIGLFLVRALVSAMGGSVSVANAPSGGAAFTLHLPVFREEQS
jgi:PAS domain S-box-containing protein